MTPGEAIEVLNRLFAERRAAVAKLPASELLAGARDLAALNLALDALMRTVRQAS